MNLTDMSSLLRASAAAILATTGLALATAPAADAGTYRVLRLQVLRREEQRRLVGDAPTAAAAATLTAAMDESVMNGAWT